MKSKNYNTYPTKVSAIPIALPKKWIKSSKDNLLNLFDPTFNINFQITDLPTGQLAEAQITNYDQYGRPNSGTIVYKHKYKSLILYKILCNT